MGRKKDTQGMTTAVLKHELEGALDYVLDELSWAAKDGDITRAKFLVDELERLERGWPAEFQRAAIIIKWRGGPPQMNNSTRH